ncbi:hypothetical protein RAS1_35940 [Phycisphaerae bacterium RAS1]|nr:hypothetical protein RAS1_35940 [Phycisphaerae bacterium RAS1]
MRLDPNDPRLTAYVLNELDANQRAAVAAALKRSPTLRVEVENIRRTAAMLSDAAASTAAGSAIALSSAERTAMIDAAASSLP